MEAATVPTSPESPEGGPNPPEIVKAAAGEDLTPREEMSALDFLLGPTTALEYDVDVKYDTPDGQKSLRFRLRQQDPSVLDEADARNRRGDGPFAKLDVQSFNAEIASIATVFIQDLATGRKVDPKAPEFRGDVPSPALAMGLRFKYQPGLLEGVAERIREVSGFGADRVGTAQRVLVDAGKASSPDEG